MKLRPSIEVANATRVVRRRTVVVSAWTVAMKLVPRPETTARRAARPAAQGEKKLRLLCVKDFWRQASSRAPRDSFQIQPAMLYKAVSVALLGSASALVLPTAPLLNNAATTRCSAVSMIDLDATRDGAAGASRRGGRHGERHWRRAVSRLRR